MRRSSRSFQALFHDSLNCFVSKRTSPRSSHPDGVLANITFAVKDNIATTSEPTTCGSAILKDYISPFDATVVSRLEAAGAVMVGKTNLDEFGMGSSTTFSDHGVTLNPLFSDSRSVGGSSGGSAAAVAAGLADFALGTDTGGSVRQPASYCGIIGFKPSYGRLSRYGVVAYGQGLDCVGILSKNVEMAGKVFDVLDVFDEKDITSMPFAIRNAISSEQSKRSDNSKLRIGIPKEFLLSEVETQTTSVLESVLQKCMDLGHAVHPISLPATSQSLSAYYTLATAEAASNLSKFDGLRYGTSETMTTSNPSSGPESQGSEDAGKRLIARMRSMKLGPEVQRRLILGNYTLSSESGDNYFKATKLREKLVTELNDIFSFPNLLTGSKANPSGCDVLIVPTTFGKAPTHIELKKEQQQNLLNEYLNDVFTVQASMAGLPALSFPGEDIHYGVQVIGQYGDDKKVLQIAELLERK